MTIELDEWLALQCHRPWVWMWRAHSRRLESMGVVDVVDVVVFVVVATTKQRRLEHRAVPFAWLARPLAHADRVR